MFMHCGTSGCWLEKVIHKRQEYLCYLIAHTMWSYHQSMEWYKCKNCHQVYQKVWYIKFSGSYRGWCFVVRWGEAKVKVASSDSSLTHMIIHLHLLLTFDFRYWWWEFCRTCMNFSDVHVLCTPSLLGSLSTTHTYAFCTHVLISAKLTLFRGTT